MDNVSRLALARKRRSEAILEREGVPYIEWLPALGVDENTVALPTAEEVAQRAMALCVVALKAEGLEQERVFDAIEGYGLEELLTDDERDFVYNEAPSEQELINFLWRYESYWVLLWALGYIEELGRPDEICDVPQAVQILSNRTADEFLRGANLRSNSEILDEADLIFRYHWATMEAHLKSAEPPAGLEPGVVYERHYTLNWLIEYSDDWDNVPTNT